MPNIIRNYYIMLTNNNIANFHELLKKGQHYEDTAITYIVKLNNVKLFDRCNSYLYDFMTIGINNNKISYEVKADIRCEQTNNVYIEYLQNDKASGISVSCSDNYIIINNKFILIIETATIKMLISQNKFIRNVKMCCMNSNNNMQTTMGYLFKLHILIEHCEHFHLF